MDENEQQATILLRNYLLEGRRPIRLENDAIELLQNPDEIPDYFLYEPTQIREILEDKNINLDELPKEWTEELLNEFRPSNYICGLKMIIIRKAIVRDYPDYLPCQYIHEYVHLMIHQEIWTQDYLIKTFDLNENLDEEGICIEIACIYAEKKGFRENYAKLQSR